MLLPATPFTPLRLSPTGGDACVPNTCAAFEELPGEEKAECEKLRVVDTMQVALFPAMRDGTPKEFAVWYSYPMRSHPLIWDHRPDEFLGQRTASARCHPGRAVTRST